MGPENPANRRSADDDAAQTVPDRSAIASIAATPSPQGERVMACKADDSHGTDAKHHKMIERPPMRFRVGHPVMFGFGVLLAIAGAFAAYSLLGGLGVTLLGLGTLFIAIRMDLERDAPVGGERNEGLFAFTLSSQRRGRPQDGHAKLTDALAFNHLNTWAQIFGAVTLLAGIALWRWGL
jgi:hypothetical protein